MQLPPAAHFLSDALDTPRDWIVLTDGTVVSCLPLSPRPNSVAIRRKAIEDKLAERKGLPPEKVETWKRDFEALQGFDVTIPEQEPEPEFRLLLNKIDRVIHHEDQWLQRVDGLVQEQNVSGALELLGRLEQRRPDWPGIQKRVDDIIFTDGNLQLAAGRTELALMLYEELARRRSDYPGLGEKAGAAIDAQLSAAVAASDFRQARYFLTRLQQIVPNTPLYQNYTQQLAGRAEALLAEAKSAQGAGQLPEAVTLLEQAARIWPEAAGLAGALKSLTERYQRVRVAVTNLPTEPTAYPFETAAQERQRRLTQIPLFEVASMDGGAARYRTRFFDEWMPYNLGRTMRFTLRQTRQPWESQPVLLGWPITDRLTERLDPGHPRFDQRFAGYVESMTVESPFEFTVAFRRVPPRLEALLTEPIVAAPSAQPADESRLAAGFTPLPAGAFVPVNGFAEPNALAYRRYFPEPDRQRQYHVAELVETRYPDEEAALRAFQLGEADLLPNPPAWIVRRILNDEAQQGQYFVQQHAVPETHVLQFNPANAVLRSREIRRALQYMIDRQRLLDEVLLREPGGNQGRVIAGPFPSNSRANAVGVEPRPYDPYAGLALTLAGINSLVTNKVIEGELPVLRILVPPDPVIRKAVERMIDNWGRIKIAAEIISEDDRTAFAEGRWDLIYRRVQMTEPAVQLWPFLTLQGTARIEDLAPFPDWLKQEVIALDRASDYSRAEDRVQSLHRHLSQEAALIPLWEIDQYTLYRKHLRGFSLRPVHCYDNIDQWVREAFVPAGNL
jgi:tetratricopeptide (TPR) repeat protein